MIKQLFGALLGIDADEYDSDEANEAWENQRYRDENDLDDDDGDGDGDDYEESYEHQRTGFLGLW